MAENTLYEDLMRQLSAIGSVRRELGRILPADCSDGAATVLAILGRGGDMRIGKLTELLGIDVGGAGLHAVRSRPSRSA